MNEFRHPEQLDDFVAGQLTEAETQDILEHLAECNTCLAEADRLWEAQDRIGMRQASPELDDFRRERLEARVLGRIRLAQLGYQFVRLGTESLAGALWTLLRPVLQIGSTKEKSGAEE